jgi:hypothetical protein
MAYLFACTKGQVLVLDHVLDLPFHGDGEQQQPVQHQDGPEHWHIKHWEQCHCDTNPYRLE